jgi:hypothetical protein
MKHKPGDIVYNWPKSFISYLERRFHDDPESLKKCKDQVNEYNKHVVVSVDEVNQTIKYKTLACDHIFNVTGTDKQLFTEEEFNIYEIQDDFVQ